MAVRETDIDNYILSERAYQYLEDGSFLPVVVCCTYCMLSCEFHGLTMLIRESDFMKNFMNESDLMRKLCNFFSVYR